VTEPTLSTLCEALLGGLRRTKPLDPSQGDLAYEGHQLLALRLHRAVRLDRPPKAGGKKAWAVFLREHFPRGDEHAELLRTAWRRPLLRNRPAGRGVVLTFGRPEAHWQQDGPGGSLILDLDGLREDVERAVSSLRAACEADPARALRVLHRYRRRPWTLETVAQPHLQPGAHPLDRVGASASTTSTSSLLRGGASTEQPG
jgi:hypothetical protein